MKTIEQLRVLMVVMEDDAITVTRLGLMQIANAFTQCDVSKFYIRTQLARKFVMTLVFANTF